MAETLENVVKLIVQQCARRGITPTVDQTLAAFVARMVVYENPDEYPLDTSLGESMVSALVADAVKLLSAEDSPQLETLRMQAAFDTAYFGNQARLEENAETHGRELAALESSISSTVPKAATDYHSRTTLYRKIFQYVTAHAGATGPSDPDVQREVAAALESVFPRVGLKSFVALTTEEKAAQLNELAHLILGIRVFNWDIGKGGAGITDIPSTALDSAKSLEGLLLTELEQVSEICQQYVDVLALPASAITESGDKENLERWKSELANRRQLSSYLGTLADDLRDDTEELQGTVDGFKAELDDLKRLVGSRASVPKEQVYPKFHALSVHWLAVSEIGDRVRARISVHDALSAFVAPAMCTLHLDTVRKARESLSTRRIPHSSTPSDKAVETSASEDSKEAPAPAPAEASAAGSGAGAESKEASTEDAPDDDRPIRLSLESSPEFMQLPLEYQGYCCHTLVTRGGLLLPGDPSLGVVRYGGRYTVFSSEAGVTEFMANPEKFTLGVIEAAKKSPELVHLLQLQAFFPQASLATIIRGDKPAVAHGSDGPAVMVDKGTETPVHFVEKHIDPRYRWNEWDMRRDALKLANLKKARTVSVQSNLSFFRRENDTQVYLPKAADTQTGVERGTNPPRMVAYMDGLRGTGPALKKGGVREEPTTKASRAVYSFDV